jgi:hypothetical protein
MAKSIQWIPESEAAKLVNRKPRTLRRLVKKGTWNVTYTTLNGRSYCYDEKGIREVFMSKAKLSA